MVWFLIGGKMEPEGASTSPVLVALLSWRLGEPLFVLELGEGVTAAGAFGVCLHGFPCGDLCFDAGFDGICLQFRPCQRTFFRLTYSPTDL